MVMPMTMMSGMKVKCTTGCTGNIFNQSCCKGATAMLMRWEGAKHAIICGKMRTILYLCNFQYCISHLADSLPGVRLLLDCLALGHPANNGEGISLANQEGTQQYDRQDG